MPLHARDETGTEPVEKEQERQLNAPERCVHEHVADVRTVGESAHVVDEVRVDVLLVDWRECEVHREV